MPTSIDVATSVLVRRLIVEATISVPVIQCSITVQCHQCQLIVAPTRWGVGVGATFNWRVSHWYGMSEPQAQ